MIDPSSIRTIFMGTPEFALPTLQGLLEAGVDLCGVFTQPDRRKGRGKVLAPPPVKELALRHNLPVLQPEKLRDPSAVEQIRSLKPDLIVVVAYGQILPKSVLDIPRYGCINVHASLLPRYRGAAPINKAVVDGEQVTGVTTMLMDVGLDTGDILVKRATEIGNEETAGELHDRLALLGREAMEETLRRLCDGTLRSEAQDDAQSCYAPMMKKEDGCIDWSRPAGVIHNLVRGLSPWPGAYTRWNGQTLKLGRTVAEEGSEAEPGTVVSADETGVCIACGEGVLRVRELQLAGKKKLPAGDFLRGTSLSAGARLGD
ncbi:methionyl-tRNA formyltransferase [Syntrophotalea carbinolica DSM 2380]|uniref:Methionyl-tRNA formyltransferase n=2 Tax=Syntrophotalea carbinolica TaxID=19 RepID=Q3A7Y7_SYNC1|nr:methionyl-tRNA formyltransferase [Syntrophotalea carbinolica]ABA87505.1 methionyl-tRNA formyltransferase [Syntrophotalea carbinolica DSM 2380]